MRKKSVAAYVSFVVQANANLTRPNVSSQCLAAARRILRLEPTVVSDLVAELAPYRVARWVAWGERPAIRRRRADLVIHLRHVVETNQGGWLDEPQFKVAMEVWQRGIDDARLHGLPQPEPAGIPLAEYQAAINSVTRSSRRPPGARAEALAEADRLRMEADRAAIAALPVLLPVLERLIKQTG